jgi:hypothetical protein
LVIFFVDALFLVVGDSDFLKTWSAKILTAFELADPRVNVDNVEVHLLNPESAKNASM